MTRILILGAPRTKKTHNQVALAGNKPGARAIVLPSKNWRKWVVTARIYGIRGSNRYLWPLKGQELPERPYNCLALFYRDAAWGDSCGFYQGLADLLQERGVVHNDRWITQWDGSRLLKDATNPRVEILLTPVQETALDSLETATQVDALRVSE